MFSLRKFSDHANLVTRMANILGIDLSKAMTRNPQIAQDWRATVVNCTRCSAPETCATWLAAQEAQAGQAPRPPSFCRNSAYLERLANA